MCDSPATTSDTDRRLPREAKLRFSVKDTGIGIPREDQRRIMEPFTQGDPSSTRRHGGTGLGLAICSELLALMGSGLSLESEPNQGSCFWFELLLECRGEPAERSPLSTPLKHLRNMPVLVVDDNETNRRIIAKRRTTPRGTICTTA